MVALVLFFAIAALALLAIRAVRDANGEQADMRTQAQALNERLQSFERALEQVREGQQRLVQRMDGSNATNQVLREEILGMGERAALLEDAVARLAQSRMSGDTVLRLNEAEFLLSMGTERLSLYGDVPSAIQALSLAEGTLAGLDDPALATLRQTLTQELIQLRELPSDPRPRLRAELAVMAGQLAALPVSRGDAVELVTPQDSRFKQLLGQLVTVRRVDPQTTLLGPAQSQAARTAIALQIDLAQAALARPDEEAFRAALDRIEQGSATLFDTKADAVVRWFARLTALRQADLSPELPALGATLRELRGLRAMRPVGRGAAVRLPPPSPSNTKAASGVSQDPQHPAPDASPAEHPEEAAQAQDDAGSDALPEVELEPVPGVRA